MKQICGSNHVHEPDKKTILSKKLYTLLIKGQRLARLVVAAGREILWDVGALQEKVNANGGAAPF